MQFLKIPRLEGRNEIAAACGVHAGVTESRAQTDNTKRQQRKVARKQPAKKSKKISAAEEAIGKFGNGSDTITYNFGHKFGFWYTGVYTGVAGENYVLSHEEEMEDKSSVIPGSFVFLFSDGEECSFDKKSLMKSFMKTNEYGWFPGVKNMFILIFLFLLLLLFFFVLILSRRPKCRT